MRNPYLDLNDEIILRMIKEHRGKPMSATSAYPGLKFEKLQVKTATVCTPEELFQTLQSLIDRQIIYVWGVHFPWSESEKTCDGQILKVPPHNMQWKEGGQSYYLMDNGKLRLDYIYVAEDRLPQTIQAALRQGHTAFPPST